MLATQNNHITYIYTNMLLKKKTFFACTVKLLLCATCLHAQNRIDSARRSTMQIQPTAYFLTQPVYQNPISGNFYARQLPFFCSKELKIEKATGIPFKFRLGSVEYCDKLEGKNR